MNGLCSAAGHLFMPGQAAESIGWPTSRFQWEVGLAGLGLGGAGVMALGFDRLWLATIIVFSIFMLGAAVGHIRSMLAEHWHPATRATSSGTTSSRRPSSS